MLRRSCSLGVKCLGSGISLPWNSALPPVSDHRWAGVGKSVVELAQRCDTGKAAFDECCVAREQLESVLQAVGYDMNVYIFGGLTILGVFEVGGDVDFVGVSDIEPGLDEAAEIVTRASRELRRLGLKTRALSKARVPVVKADRVNSSEASSFEERLLDNFSARSVEWNGTFQFATVQFESTTALMYALAHVRDHESIEIPLRLPVDVRYGPEVYRFPFDFTLSSTGLRNSHLLSRALQGYPYSRHLLLALKKWGRSSGIVNSVDGLLASYALTVMLVHFLGKTNVFPEISSQRITEEPQVVDVAPAYRPLDSGAATDVGDVGFLFAAFLEYYGTVFNYKKDVVCTTNTALTKAAMNWADRTNVTNRPPFFEFCIKDPFGLDNIGRNLDAEATEYVRGAHSMALTQLLKEFDEPHFAVENLIAAPPRPPRYSKLLTERGVHSDFLSSDQLEARHVLHKVEFSERRKDMERFGRRAAQNYENQHAATAVAKNVLGWIRKDGST